MDTTYTTRYCYLINKSLIRTEAYWSGFKDYRIASTITEISQKKYLLLLFSFSESTIYPSFHKFSYCPLDVLISDDNNIDKWNPMDWQSGLELGLRPTVHNQLVMIDGLFRHLDNNNRIKCLLLFYCHSSVTFSCLIRIRSSGEVPSYHSQPNDWKKSQIHGLGRFSHWFRLSNMTRSSDYTKWRRNNCLPSYLRDKTHDKVLLVYSGVVR